MTGEGARTKPLKLLAGEWSTRDDEELCAHEIGDMLTLLLFVLGVK